MPKSLDSARQRVDNATDRASKQARGTARNTRELAGSFSVDRIIPNGVASFFEEVLEVVAYAAGRGTAEQQVWASIKGIIVALVFTPFTFGYSLALAIPFVFTLFIGLLRLVPAANKNFRSTTGDSLRDRDIPWWRD